MDRPGIATSLRSERAAFLVGGGAFLTHLLLVRLPFVNLEYTFSSAARYFVSGDALSLAVYFYYEANTLGLPLLSAMLHALVPFLDIEYLPRLVSILGIPLLTVALVRLNRLLGAGKVPPALVVGLCLLNPFVWVYSGRGTADFLPMAVGVFGLSLIWGATLTTRRIVSASAVLGIAIVLKYHAGIFLLLALADVVLRRDATPQRRIGTAALCAVAAGLLPLLYLVIVKERFGFWVTPPVHQVGLRIKPEGAVMNFVAYLTYLVIVLFPVTLVAIAAVPMPKHRRLLIGSVVLLATILSAAYVKPVGEMGFGPLDRIIPSWVLGMLSAVGALLFCAIVVRIIRGEDRDERSPYLRYAAIGVLFYVAVLSLSRPAQRYLMLPLPVAYLMFFGHRNSTRLVSASIAALPLFALVDGVITAHQQVGGAAASALAAQIGAAGLLPVTDAGEITGHAGLPFFPYREREKTFTVVVGKRPGAILSSEESLFGIVTSAFSVVPIRPTAPK